MKNIDFTIDELDNHFTEKLNESLYEIEKRLTNNEKSHFNTLSDQGAEIVYESSYRENDSPLTMSINSDYDENYTIHNSLSCDNISIDDNLNTTQASRSGGCAISSHGHINTRKHRITPTSNVLASALSFDDKSSTDKSRTLSVVPTSCVLAIAVINIYCKGQKYMYEQASIITQYQHNAIYCITISITSGVCIFITFMETSWKNIIIIVLNAIVCILLVILKYLKLETSAELYLYISKQFEFIYNMSNKFPENTVGCNKIIPEKMKALEDRIVETMDIPSMNIPQIIQKLYPITTNINIFAFIKKVDTQKEYISHELQKLNTELQYIVKKYNNNMGARESQRFHFLLDIKKTLKKEQNDIKNAYSYMEELLTVEINKADFYTYNCMRMYFSNNTDFSIDHSHCNPFVDEYIRFIIPKYK